MWKKREELTEEDDYSASSTLITFPKPIPPIRVPIPATRPDNPELGPYILAFPSPSSFLTSLTTSQTNLQKQCISGSRVGCAIAASKACTPPWWKGVLPRQRVDFKEREECEEREMKGCLLGCEDKCAKFAEDKCLGPFRGARVRKVGGGEKGIGLFGFLGRDVGLGSGFDDVGGDDEVGYVRGSDILGLGWSELSN